MNLDQITDEELEEELKKRKREKELREAPKLIINPDLTELKKRLQKYVDYIAENNMEKDDDEHWIYEITIETFFGKHFWMWFNKKSTMNENDE